jgi:hypothetical protein
MQASRLSDTASVLAPILTGIGSYISANPESALFGFLTILLGFIGALLSVYEKMQRISYNCERKTRIKKLRENKVKNEALN